MWQGPRAAGDATPRVTMISAPSRTACSRRGRRDRRPRRRSGTRGSSRSGSRCPPGRRSPLPLDQQRPQALRSAIDRGRQAGRPAADHREVVHVVLRRRLQPDRGGQRRPARVGQHGAVGQHHDGAGRGRRNPVRRIVAPGRPRSARSAHSNRTWLRDRKSRIPYRRGRRSDRSARAGAGARWPASRALDAPRHLGRDAVAEDPPTPGRGGRTPACRTAPPAAASWRARRRRTAPRARSAARRGSRRASRGPRAGAARPGSASTGRRSRTAARRTRPARLRAPATVPRRPGHRRRGPRRD